MSHRGSPPEEHVELMNSEKFACSTCPAGCPIPWGACANDEIIDLYVARCSPFTKYVI